MSSLLVIFVWGGGWSNFVGSESGQKQSVKLLQNMVYKDNSTPPPPPQPHTVCINCTFSFVRGGSHKEGRGATVHKYRSFVHGGNSSQPGSKIPTMSECLKKSWHLGFGVFIVHSSMGLWLRGQQCPPPPLHPPPEKRDNWVSREGGYLIV